MPDRFQKSMRSRIMSSIRGKNTKIEITIRKMMWANGLRYRIHDRSVFGKPDISNKRLHVAVFIDGCFWHACNRCYKEPRTNRRFWREKISSNLERRRIVIEKLGLEGWKILQFWEHDIKKSPEAVCNKIIETFSERNSPQ